MGRSKREVDFAEVVSAIGCCFLNWPMKVICDRVQPVVSAGRFSAVLASSSQANRAARGFFSHGVLFEVREPSRVNCHKLSKPFVALVAISCSWSVMRTSAIAADRPNVLVVLCDDLGYGDLECYGHPHIKTPNLNRLASTGIRLTNCYSAAPVCSPSRVGLLTGRSPNLAGVYDWIPSVNRPKSDLRDLVHMRRSEVTIAQLLLDSGYATCMAGKWHCNSDFNSPNQPQPNDAGFQHWFGTQNNAAPSHLNPENFVRNGEPVGPMSGSSCQLVVTEATRWMESHVAENPEQPFFMYVAFHEPHEPVASPDQLVQQYRSVSRSEDEAQYFANVANVDHAVGRLVQALDAAGQRENTLIVFTSDNGPETLLRYKNANRSFGRATPLRGMKLWTTDAGFRVAGIVNWPAKIKQSSTSDLVVSSLDLLPTCCELADCELPAKRRLDGTSWLPWLEGRSLDRTRPLVWCYFNATNEHRVAMRSGPWKLLAKLDAGAFPKIQNVHSDNRAKVMSAQLTDFELYDVAKDIHEEFNVFGKAAESKQLQETLETRFQQLLENSHVWKRS